MSDKALRQLIAVTCVCVIAAAGLFFAVTARDLYVSHKKAQTDELAALLQRHQALTDAVNRQSGRR